MPVAFAAQLMTGDRSCPRYVIDIRTTRENLEGDGNAARCAWKTGDDTYVDCDGNQKTTNLDWSGHARTWSQMSETDINLHPFVQAVNDIVKPDCGNDAATLGDDYKSTPILVYCASGARAFNAVAALKSAGYSDVTNGGGWVTDRDALTKICTCYNVAYEFAFQFMIILKSYMLHQI